MNTLLSCPIRLTLAAACLFALVLALAGFVEAENQAKSEGRILVRAGHLLDIKSGKDAVGETIVVTGDRITSIAPTASTPTEPGDKEIDLGNFYVLPGLIDVHTHLTMTDSMDPYAQSAAKLALTGAENAKKRLEEGNTTVRDVGTSYFADVALRDEINAGRLPGPHMQASGPLLGITGGHCDENIFPYEMHFAAEGVADGVAAVQHRVRENIKYGSDLIKVCATGGVTSKGDNPQASQYTLDELRAIVADAHRLGRKVAAHAHGAQGILWASEAGADSIEHGSYINDEAIAAMKEHGTYLVPTAYVYDSARADSHLPDYAMKKLEEVALVAKQNLKRAIAAGVKVALGTDQNPDGVVGHELDVYVNQLGMSPLAALQTATVNAADLMGWSDRVGSLESGKWADIIAVPTDPLKDVRVLQRVSFVMKSGVVYKSDIEMAPKN